MCMRSLSLAVSLVIAAFFGSAHMTAAKEQKPLPPQNPTSTSSTCEINGRKGFKPAGSETCIIISGYVSATVGVKPH